MTTKKYAKSPTKDVHADVTNAIIAALENCGEYTRPWTLISKQPTRHNGEYYQGINWLVLTVTAVNKGYSNPMWITFNQAAELVDSAPGNGVRKGEKGTQVIYYKILERDEHNEAGDIEKKRIPMLKTYTVFNVEQIAGLPEKYYASNLPASANTRIDDIEAIVAATGATITHAGNRACYSPITGNVTMPQLEQFNSTTSYYSTLMHELVHWTSHESRLGRQMGKPGTDEYALEELVAELGAAMLCTALGLPQQVEDQHAPYIAGWLKALKNDKKLIFKAATMASKAASFIMPATADQCIQEAA